MFRRLWWFAMGVLVGVIAVTRGPELMDRVTPTTFMKGVGKAVEAHGPKLATFFSEQIDSYSRSR